MTAAMVATVNVQAAISAIAMTLAICVVVFTYSVKQTQKGRHESGRSPVSYGMTAILILLGAIVVTAAWPTLWLAVVVLAVVSEVGWWANWRYARRHPRLDTRMGPR